MTNIHPVSTERHAHTRWQRFTSYNFCKTDSVYPVTVQEVARALMGMPLAFINNEDQYLLVALQGIKPGENLFVHENGRWRGRYIPQGYWCYPFLMLRGQDEKMVLCVDEDSGLITDVDSTQGEAFFDNDANPDKQLGEVVQFLTNHTMAKLKTNTVCAMLQKHGLITPWPLTVALDGSERRVKGLFCIDESGLNKLSGDALEELRNADALTVAYSQLFSMRNVKQLIQLEKNQQNTGQVAGNNPLAEINFDTGDDSGSINFDNF